LEYTDAPVTEAAPNETETTSCPRCGAVLPKDAHSCSRCGWTQGQPSEGAEGKASDLVAMLLSVVPGLGHIYKGHRLVGALLILGAPLAVALSALAATATAGFGLGLMVFYWFAAGFHAYAISDRVTPGIRDEGEQY
jgi:ribosomal protein L40E